VAQPATNAIDATQATIAWATDCLPLVVVSIMIVFPYHAS
jgi:hypothetical protein